MAEQDLDRNEDATPYKLERARERGSVAKSAEVNTLGCMAVASIACFACVPSIVRDLTQTMQKLWTYAGVDLSDGAARSTLISVVATSVPRLLAPVLLGVVLVAFVTNVMQTGPVFSAEPIKPDFNRLNPMNGFQKLFSMRSLYDAVRSAIKLLVLGVIAANVIVAFLPGAWSMAAADAKAYLPKLLAAVAALVVKLVAGLLVIAAIDIVYVRREYAKRMRMSRRDIKDEHKQREGDPRIRSRIRELRMKLLKRSRALREVPNADVLITNPTHIAIAVGYEHGKSPAPRILAKGTGSVAQQMRELASRHQIPVVQNVPLARALYRQVDDGDYVPEQWYAQLAKILVWVLASRQASVTPSPQSAS